MKIENTASTVIISSFGSIKVMVCELLRNIDNKINAMNSELAKFAANKTTHLSLNLKNSDTSFFLKIRSQ
jgi:hypothetical protein